MGIRGLTGFIDSNPHLLNSYALADSHVIIDGNNLCHILYYDSHVEHLFGGDYDKFYKRARSYFLIYKKCNIVPYVIFDGGYHASDMKFKTTLSRLRDRFNTTRVQSKGYLLHKRSLPIMGREVLIDVLVDLHIPHAQCDFEADNQIVALANHFNCPVLSLDSDFYIFDLKGGFIPLNSIDSEMKPNSNADCKAKYYLDCQIYHVNNFLEYFEGLDRSVLPLFATVMGNDFVDLRTFNNVFNNISLPNVKAKDLFVRHRHRKMIGLLWWLQSKTTEEATEQILGFLKEGKKEKTKQLIRQSIENYVNFESTLVDALGLHSELTSKPFQLTNSRSGKQLPEKFSKWFCQALMPPFFLNVINLHRVFLQSQVECLWFPSSYTASLYLRKVIYGILLQEESDSKVAVKVDEYDRRKYDIVKNVIVPLKRLPKFGQLPTLEQSCNLSRDEIMKLMCEVMQVDVEFPSLLPRQIQYPLMIIKFWICHSSQPLTENHVDAVLLCMLSLTLFNRHRIVKPDNESPICIKENQEKTDPIKTDKAEKGLDDILAATEEMTASEITCVQNNLKKFFQKLEFKKDRLFDIETIHVFAEYHTCLFFASYLNKLLGHPFPKVRMGSIMNGTFLYSMCKETMKRPFPELYISELLGRSSSCCTIFLGVKKHLLSHVPGNLVLKPKLVVKHNKKMKRKSLLAASAALASEIEESSKERKQVKAGKKIQSHIELANKFEHLMNLDSDSSVEFEYVSDIDVE